MGESENVTLMKAAYAAFDRGDVAGLLEMLAPDVEWNWPAVKEIPHSGPRRGRHEAAAFFETLTAVEEPVEFRRDEFLAHGDRVVVLGTYRARAKSSGGHWESDFVHVWTVREGRIARFDIQYNTAAAVEAYRTAAAARHSTTKASASGPGDGRATARGRWRAQSGTAILRLPVCGRVLRFRADDPIEPERDIARRSLRASVARYRLLLRSCGRVGRW